MHFSYLDVVCGEIGHPGSSERRKEGKVSGQEGGLDNCLQAQHKGEPEAMAARLRKT